MLRTSAFNLLPTLSSISKASLLLLGWLFWLICILVRSPSSSVHPSAARWLQSAFGWLREMVLSTCSKDYFLLQLFPFPMPVHLHVVYSAVIRQSNALPCVCHCQCPRMLLVWEICFFTLVFSLYWCTYTPLTNHISPLSKASPFACSTNKFSLSLLNWSWRELHICLIVFSLCKGKVLVAKQLLSQY